jgi:hypothetical protein
MDPDSFKFGPYYRICLIVPVRSIVDDSTRRTIKERIEIMFNNFPRPRPEQPSNINGQFIINKPFSACNSEEVTIARTLASSDAPRNWASFCTDADKALEDVTKAKAFFKNFGPLNLICNIGVLFAIFWYFQTRSSSSSRSGMGLIVAGALFAFSLSTTIVASKRLIAGMAKLEVVCQNHSGNGIRYVLCKYRQMSGRYFVKVMNHDAEGQQQDQAGGTAVVNTATESVPGSPWNTSSPSPSSTFQLSSATASASSAYVDPQAYAPSTNPQPYAPSTNQYPQAAPAPAPATTTGNSLFDQLSK